jgi:hypothetical protein
MWLWIYDGGGYGVAIHLGLKELESALKNITYFVLQSFC